MISANNITLRIGKKALFEDVNIKFTEGNCNTLYKNPKIFINKVKFMYKRAQWL